MIFILLLERFCNDDTALTITLKVNYKHYISKENFKNITHTKQDIKMTYRWEYVRVQLKPYHELVLKCSSRSFLNRADALANAMQNGGTLQSDYQVALLLIKERDDMLTSPLSNYAARVETFKNWPPSIAVKPESLAVAGFFYEGIGDRVTCYSCGKSLKSWLPMDSPWVEHQKYSPTCAHLGWPRSTDYDTLSQSIWGPPRRDSNHCGTSEVCDGGDFIDHDTCGSNTP